MDNEKCILLIDLYKEHHLLWDPKHKHYHNNTFREDVWKEISLILEVPVDILKTEVIDGHLQKRKIKTKTKSDYRIRYGFYYLSRYRLQFNFFILSYFFKLKLKNVNICVFFRKEQCL